MHANDHYRAWQMAADAMERDASVYKTDSAKMIGMLLALFARHVASAYATIEQEKTQVRQ